MQSPTESGNRGNLVLKICAKADRNPSQLFYMWLPSSLIYKCKVLIQVMREKWQCWSIRATQIRNQRDTFLCLDSLNEVISVCFGIYGALGCFSVQIICPFSHSDKEYFMEMHPYSRHLNGVCWSGTPSWWGCCLSLINVKKQRKCQAWAQLQRAFCLGISNA